MPSLKPIKVILCFFMFFGRASLYNLFQMKPSGCTLLLSIFISISVHVSGSYVPIIRGTYCMYATLVWLKNTIQIETYQTATHTGWKIKWVSSHPADQTATHTEWKIPASHRYSKFSWWWAHKGPITGLDRPRGFQEVKVPRFRDNGTGCW